MKREKNLSFKNNISYQLYDISILYKVLIKIYNRVFVPISFLFFKFKYFLDFIVRNLSQNSFKNLVEQNCDILICPAVLLKHYNLKVPTLTNLHDIQHEHFRNFFSKSELLRRDIQYYNSAKYTTKMIASGPFMKKDFIKKFFFLKKKISLIYEGVDINRFRKNSNSTKLKIFSRIKIF